MPDINLLLKIRFHLRSTWLMRLLTKNNQVHLFWISILKESQMYLLKIQITHYSKRWDKQNKKLGQLFIMICWIRNKLFKVKNFMMSFRIGNSIIFINKSVINKLNSLILISWCNLSKTIIKLKLIQFLIMMYWMRLNLLFNLEKQRFKMIKILKFRSMIPILLM
jgi:hypothetical protein